MAATATLGTELLEAQNTDTEKNIETENLILDEQTRSLTVLETLPSAEAKEWLGKVRRVVEEALTRQSRRMAEREGLIQEQSEMIARMSMELRHVQDIAEKQRELSDETQRRMRATNHNMRSALEERDRKLIVFARKLSKLRQERDGREEARREIIAELKRTKWHQGRQKRALLAALEALG